MTRYIISAVSDTFDPEAARERARRRAGAATRESNSGEAHMALDVLDLLDLLAARDERITFLERHDAHWEKIAETTHKLLDAATDVIEAQKMMIAQLRGSGT